VAIQNTYYHSDIQGHGLPPALAGGFNKCNFKFGFSQKSN
jgi:hypothetical protein